jgi:hypothetical protein
MINKISYEIPKYIEGFGCMARVATIIREG